MTPGLFSKKSVDELLQANDLDSDKGLDKSLGLVALIALGIGGIIGAGIFVLTGQAAANYAGPSITISFILAAIGCGLCGLCYAEFASLIPIAGSAYTYAYATLGELVAWIVGWDLILEYIFSGATVAVGWSGYMVSLLQDVGIVIPAELANPPFNLPAMFIIALMTILQIIGLRQSTRFNNIIVLVKTLVILLFIFGGLGYINQQNWLPFIPENTGQFGIYGWSGVLRGAGVVFFTYIGFDAISCAAQEARNPQRDMPIAIMSSLLIATILYIAVVLVLTGIVPYTELNVPDPIAVGVNAVGEGLRWLKPIIKIGAIAGMSSVIVVFILGQSRVFYAMAKDGLLPSPFAAVHPQFRTPYISIVVSGVVAMLLAGLLPISVLGELVSIGTLLAFLIVCIAVAVLRRTRPDLPRPFKTPLVPLVPILGALISGLQMVSLPGDTWLRLIIWLAVGLLIYFTYGRQHSTLQQKRIQQTD
ncbi:amino acid permease [Microseira wollei]|uniref:Amino acid transporter n=1 Tax=Microseira wollei NIES-4236 TaxID=2530354 RepID=A0AAV3X013_9CYAN|nr:amino acid permease [Microseira wollei]GET35987.1 putative amino acid transporter [Microseira wollei NIES-4236]